MSALEHDDVLDSAIAEASSETRAAQCEVHLDLPDTLPILPATPSRCAAPSKI